MVSLRAASPSGSYEEEGFSMHGPYNPQAP